MQIKTIDDSKLLKLKSINKLGISKISTMYENKEGYMVVVDIPSNYESITDDSNLYTKLMRIKNISDLVFELYKRGFYLIDLDFKNFMANGEDIILSNPLSILTQEELDDLVYKDVSKYLYTTINIFTICYLNDIPSEKVNESITEALKNFYNKVESRPLYGVNDNENTLDISAYLLNSKNLKDDLLIDYMDFSSYKEKTLIKKNQ